MYASHQPWATFLDLKPKIFLFLCLIVIASSQLSPNFYDSSCPGALTTIKTQVISAVSKEPRMGASLLRLHFHDCFVQGCDASILLNDTSTFLGEQTAFPNINSIRGLDVIENIKMKVEAICPGVVSCADIVALAARDGIVALGGPSWSVGLGRRDSTTANFTAANADLPSPFLDLQGLSNAFGKKNFTVKEMVALSGAHTTGKASCAVFRARIYGGTDIDPSYASTLQMLCPRTGGDRNLTNLDVTTPIVFDNAYYFNLIKKKGLLKSDQVLYSGGYTDSQVSDYVVNPLLFRMDFANAMVKMSNLSPLTGTNGQIRKVCSRVN